MRIEIENIYSILPFDNNVKLNIYKQLYTKKHIMITDEFKYELKNYLKYYDIIKYYQSIFETSNNNENHYTYKLLEDLILYFYGKSIKDAEYKILKQSIFNNFFQIMNLNHRLISQKLRLHYSKQIWNYMTTEERYDFHENNKICLN